MPWFGQAGEVNRLAQELELAIGCPVEVSYLEDTREVIAMAYPKPGRVVQVILTVPIALPLIENPFAAVKYVLLKQLRFQLSQEPDEGC
jgi:hypothetical protein